MWRDWEDIWGYYRQDLVMDAWGQEKSRMAACAWLLRQLTETCHAGRRLVQEDDGFEVPVRYLRAPFGSFIKF